MINAVVYTSNTGYTAEYAKLIGSATGLPVYSVGEAKKKLAGGSKIIYLGWLMASRIKDYKKADGLYDIKAVCGVGMGGTGTQCQEIRKANALPEALPLFSLQGGFDMNKLHGVYKFMMKIMKSVLGGQLKNKSDRTADEDAMLDMLNNGASYVSIENLAAFNEWYRSAAGTV